MANQDRLERYSKVRAFLGFPKEQKPSPHAIFNQMMVEEQLILNRVNNTGKAWSLINYNLTTVSGQSEYEIVQPVSGNQESGKVFEVLRATGNDDLPFVNVQFDDANQLDFGKLPNMSANLFPHQSIEKIAFYRTGMQNQKKMAVIQPVPQQVLTYKITFFTGLIDRLFALFTQSGLVTEVADYADLQTAIKQLPYAEWSGLSRAENSEERKNIMTGLAYQLSEQKPVFEEYINNINNPTDFDLGYWND